MDMHWWYQKADGSDFWNSCQMLRHQSCVMMLLRAACLWCYFRIRKLEMETCFNNTFPSANHLLHFTFVSVLFPKNLLHFYWVDPFAAKCLTFGFPSPLGAWNPLRLAPHVANGPKMLQSSWATRKFTWENSSTSEKQKWRLGSFSNVIILVATVFSW